MLQRFISFISATLTLAVAPVALHALTYDVGVVLRAPRRAGEGTLIPYAVAGAGGITIHPVGSGSSWTRPAGSIGAGLEYRFARWGARAEARDFMYQFDQYGYDHTQNQVAWQGGLTLSF